MFFLAFEVFFKLFANKYGRRLYLRVYTYESLPCVSIDDQFSNNFYKRKVAVGVPIDDSGEVVTTSRNELGLVRKVQD